MNSDYNIFDGGENDGMTMNIVLMEECRLDTEQIKNNQSKDHKNLIKCYFLSNLGNQKKKTKM